jgi:tetratricopeptide (TPR) repeat protein
VTPQPLAPSASPLDRAAALLGSDPRAAEQLAAGLLRQAPGDPRVRLILGSAKRRLGDLAGARALIEPLAKAHPKAALTQYEYGLVLAAEGEFSSAAEALQRTLAANPNHVDAWRALGDALFALGDNRAADAAFAKQALAAVQDPALRPALAARQTGEAARAETLVREVLARQAAHPEALQLMAELHLAAGRFADAEVLFDHALRLDPARAGARFGRASARFHEQKGPAALADIDELLKAEPDAAPYLNLKAAVLSLLGREEDALKLYEALLARFPRQPRLWLNQAHVLKTLGRRELAVAAYREAIALDPGLSDAFLGLANMKVYRFTAEELAAMEQLLQAPALSLDERVQLHFAAGKAHEDAGGAEAAFAHYAKGGALKRQGQAYDAAETTRQFARAKAAFTPALFAAKAGAGCDDPAPIFVVGLPRSGSTLIEQILASHSAVEGAMELNDLGLLARGLEFYPEGLGELSANALRELGESYLETTQVHRKLGRPYFVDKMPNNFQHVGLIKLILPRAKVIDARRHPLGVGFSAFKQLFAQGQTFTYDLTDLGLYYRDYVDLMAHYDRVLPGFVHRVIYEDVVDDPEAEVRRLLAFCGLEFEPACLKFYETERAVRTVSSEQVRQPIFREGRDQWRQYEPYLGPLKAALGPALENWR